MKKHILPFALILFLTMQTNAQTNVYHPFPDSNAYWNEFDSYYEGMNCGVNYIYSRYLNGDTMIGGRLYQNISEAGYYYGYNCPYGEYDTTGFGASRYYAIRQDIANKRVFISTSDSTEELLYDFNLSLGDTLPATYSFDIDVSYDPLWFNDSNYNYVSKIDSILIGDNYRKRYWLSTLNYTGFGDSNYVALIEGIGSTFGLMAQLLPGVPLYGPYQSLSCFNQDGENLYSYYGDCVLQAVGIKELFVENSISLYPNPATNQLTIHTAGQSFNRATVSIMNVLGQEASPPSPLQGRGDDAVIDISGLQAGMYFLQLKTESGSVVKKFVKE